MRRKSTATASWLSSTAARCKSRTCQPAPADRTAMCMVLPGGNSQLSLASHSLKKGTLENVWFSPAKEMTPSAHQVVKDDLGRTEQKRIDLIKVVPVAPENL